MISLDKNFLFIHIPKTGGNSIQNVLSKYSKDEKVVLSAWGQDGINRFGLKSFMSSNISKHSSINEYKENVKPEIYNSLFKFAVVRNPWDRAISFYFSPHRQKENWNKDLFKGALSKLKPIRHYIVSSSKSILDEEVDLIIRYENLQEDFKKVCGVLNIQDEELPHVNKSKRRDYKDYYDAELIKLVENKFEEEIDLFRYKF